jgi:integrase
VKFKVGCLQYLSQFESKNTIYTYMAAIKKFLETVYGVKVKGREELELHATRYLQERAGNLQKIMEDVQGFTAAIKDMPPKTRKTYLAAIKTFLVENNVELPQLFWRRLRGRVKGSHPVSEEAVPSKTVLRSVMMHLPTVGKALFLTLLSSGMRIGEALQIKIADLELEHDPPMIHIRAEYTKTGEKRICFITPEAAEAIREWLKIRDQWIKAAARKSHLYKKNVDDQRLFPMRGANARVIWRRALHKTGNGKVDPRTRRLLIHPHVLRKYFRSIVGSIVSVDVAEALMGHHSYLTEVYRKYPDPERYLGEAYKKAIPELQIFTQPHPSEEKIKQVEERNRLLENLNMQLQARVIQLENEYRDFKQQTLREIEELKKLVQQLMQPQH